MMFERHSLKVDGYSAIAPENIANECFFRIMESKTIKLIKSYRSNEKSYKKHAQLHKQRKSSGNGEYNLLIKYVKCHQHTRYEATMCSPQILTSQKSNTIF